MFSEVTYGMVILVDRLVYEVMDMINRHARITFKQEGNNPTHISYHCRLLQERFKRGKPTYIE